MGFLYWIIVGLIAGWLAGVVMKGGGYGVLMDIVLGVIGGILGGWLFGALGFSSGEASLDRSSSHSLVQSFSWQSRGCFDACSHDRVRT